MTAVNVVFNPPGPGRAKFRFTRLCAFLLQIFVNPAITDCVVYLQESSRHLKLQKTEHAADKMSKNQSR